MPLVVTLPAYSRAARSLAVSITPGMVSLQSSHTPCVGSLFSRYPSRLAWSRHGLLTRLAWVRCSGGIHHAWHGLVGVTSHAFRGLVVLAVSVTPDVVSSHIRKKMCVQTHRLHPDAPGARDALDAPSQRTYRSQRKAHRQCEFGHS